MPAPVGLPDEVAAYLQELEGRISLLETPQGPVPGVIMASTDLTAANAVQNAARWAWLSDLKTFAASNGVHWYRADTGAQIV